MARSNGKQRKAERLARSIRRGDLAAAAKLIARHAMAPVRRGPSPAREPSAPVSLAQVCPGQELAVTTPAGEAACYLVRRTLAEVHQQAAAIQAEYAAVLRGARQQFDELGASPGLCHAADARPEDLLLIRAEAGQSDNEMVFLVGLMSYAAERLVFEQLLAREEREEAAVLQAFADRRDAAGVLVTFSGRPSQLKRIERRCPSGRSAAGPRAAAHGAAGARGDGRGRAAGWRGG